LKPPHKISVAMNFFTSGLGGVLGWIAVHPANTLAVQMTLQQASHGPGASPIPSLPSRGI